MSLIQEALKRKREEEQFQPPQEMPPAPPVEAPTELPAMNEEPKRDADKRFFILVSVITVLVLILLGTVKLLRTDKAPAAEIEPVEPVAVVEAPIPPPPPVIEKEPEPKPEPKIRWPKLQLTGFASGGGQRMVIINGKMLSEGRTIEGARIVQIGRSEVLVELNGEQRLLRVDDE